MSKRKPNGTSKDGRQFIVTPVTSEDRAPSGYVLMWPDEFLLMMKGVPMPIHMVILLLLCRKLLDKELVHVFTTQEIQERYLHYSGKPLSDSALSRSIHLLEKLGVLAIVRKREIIDRFRFLFRRGTRARLFVLNPAVFCYGSPAYHKETKELWRELQEDARENDEIASWLPTLT